MLNTIKIPENEMKPTGAITLYCEFNVAMQNKITMIEKLSTLFESLKAKDGFLTATLKNTIGDSTMVYNYPSMYKGILQNAKLEAAQENSLPLFYAVFIRFENYDALVNSNIDTKLDEIINPLVVLKSHVHMGLYKTIGAGNREEIYISDEEVQEFLLNHNDEPALDFVTVNNHVSIYAEDKEIFNQNTLKMLDVAQDTFRPAPGDSDYNEMFKNGMPGSFQNSYYRKAVTTEFLQSAFPVDGKYLCLFHGTWESVYDHENSHSDIRFRKGIMTMLPFVVDGPMEPFYKTIVHKSCKI